MIQKEVKLCGKPVTLAYCFATEICYKILTDEDIHDFITTAITDINDKRMPDTRKSIFLILAAMQAFYESKGRKTPVGDKQLMYEATPEELGTAIGTVIALFAEFNQLPAGEPEEKKTDEEPKNA